MATVTVPWLGPVASTKVRVSPSGSLSLVATVAVIGVLTGVETVSSTAFGASFTGTTAMVLIAVPET